MRGERWFSISFWTCCALIAVPLWSVDYLPMADLPQHAAQLGIWTRWNDPEFGYREIYTQNWFTPYLMGYVLAFVLTPFLSVKTALVTVITASLVAIPVATLALIRECGGNRWWVFSVFPCLFGFAFDWGFYSFLVGTPVALAVLAVSLRFVKRPSPLAGVGFAVAMVALFFAHALLFLYVSLVFCVAVVSEWRGWRKALATVAPLVALVPMVALWAVVTRDNEAMTHKPMKWERLIRPPEGPRALRFVAEVVGDDVSPRSLIVAVAAFALPFVLGARMSRSPARWGPFVVTLVCYLAIPHEAFGTGFLYSRFAIFAMPTWLLALDWDRSRDMSPVRCAAGPALASFWLFVTATQFWSYEPGVKGLGEVIRRMPSNAHVLSVPIYAYDRYMRTPVYLHAPLWYQAEKGGVVDFSFASNFPSLFRYRPKHQSKVPRRFVWYQTPRDWSAFSVAPYDFLIVRDTGGTPSDVVLENAASVTFEGRAGPWQLFSQDGP